MSEDLKAKIHRLYEEAYTGLEFPFLSVEDVIVEASVSSARIT